MGLYRGFGSLRSLVRVAFTLSLKLSLPVRKGQAKVSCSDALLAPFHYTLAPNLTLSFLKLPLTCAYHSVRGLGSGTAYHSGVVPAPVVMGGLA